VISLATQVPWLAQLKGTEWFIFKARVSTCVMSGFAIGLSLHKHSRRKEEEIVRSFRKNYQRWNSLPRMRFVKSGNAICSLNFCLALTAPSKTG
jgi:hypothetical protein